MKNINALTEQLYKNFSIFAVTNNSNYIIHKT